MAKTEKVEKVAALKERITGSQAVLLTDFRGLTVQDATELRRSLGEGGTSFSVVKNTLMKRAADAAGASQLEPLLSGPTAVAFVGGDPVSAAKKVVDAAKKFPTLVLKGAFMDGKVLSAEEAQSLATLESRETMLSKIAGLLKAEMSRAASMFVALQGRFLGVLEAYRDKLPGAEVETPAADPDEAAAETADAATEAADDATTSETAETADAAVVASADPGDASADSETHNVEEAEGEE